MKNVPRGSSFKELAGLSVFLSWVLCVFYQGTVWPSSNGWLKALLPMAGMAVAGVLGTVSALLLARQLKGPWEWPSWVPWVSATMAAAGTMLLAGAGGSNDPVRAGAACLVTAIGFSAFVVLWGSRVSLMEGVSIEVVIPTALALSSVAAFVIDLAEPEAAAYIVILLPFASALLYGLWRPAPRLAATAGNPTRKLFLSTEPDSSLSLDSIASSASATSSPAPHLNLHACAAAAVILFAFRFWYGVVSAVTTGLHPEHELNAIVRLAVTLAVFAVFVGAALLLARSVNASLAVSWMLPIVLATLAFMHWNSDAGVWCVQIANNALSPCSQAFFYILFAKSACRNARQGVFLFSCFLAGLALGTSLGLAVGTQLSLALPHNQILFVLSAVAAIVGTLAFPLMRIAHRLGAPVQEASIAANEPTRTDGLDAPVERATAKQAEILAQRFDLSAREQEVLALLLMGRNRPYIRDALYISINTVNTHTKRIYAKLDVHSQQELIDLAYEDLPTV